MNIVEELRKSDNKVLKSQGENIEKWSKLRHNKSDFELFLEFNIAHIKFKPNKSDKWTEIYCTSNTVLISTLSAIKKSAKKKIVNEKKFDGIKTKDQFSIMTYNIVEDKYNTVNLKAWEIIEFMTITPENVLILDDIICNMLNKKVLND